MNISRRALFALAAASAFVRGIPALAAKPKPMMIEHLREAGWDGWGDIRGGFVRGHVDPMEFARRFVATTDEDDMAALFGDEIFDEETGDIADEEALVQAVLADVRHVHAEIEQRGEEEDSDWVFHTYSEAGPNTFPATHFFWS